ncbi:MAG: dTDP-4-dehydrorhamnose reductase [Mesorhizobium amorphae]|nr:MAG: dTDP-4-dehydrorhamnose reductase [Mesorhizobium amorphae]
MKTVLVAGREGQVARALAELADERFRFVCLGRPDLDITDRASVRRAIEAERPDAIVNAAAYTAVDKAESEPELAYAANRDGPANLAEAAADAGLPLVHLSTDYVFPGTSQDPYRETDPTGPLGVYGRSKLAGEEAVAAAQPAHAILRTAWVYGPHGANFLKTMLRLAKDREEIGVVADQRGTPTYAPDIAEAITAVLAKALAAPDDTNWRGTFHMVATGETDWAGFATEIFRQSAAQGGPHARVRRITTADYPTPAKRPANSLLDTTRFRETFGHVLPRWESGVERCLVSLVAAGSK